MRAFDDSVNAQGRDHRFKAKRDRCGSLLLTSGGLLSLIAILCLTLLMTDIAQAVPVEHSIATLQSNLVPAEEPESNVQDLEIVSLMFGLAALALVVLNWSKLMRIPGSRWWIAALLTREVAWIATVLESFFWPRTLDMVEHLFLAASSILMAVGACHIFRGDAKEVIAKT